MRAHGAGQATVELEDAGLQHGAKGHGGGQIAVFDLDGALGMGLTHDRLERFHRIGVIAHIAQMGVLVEQDETEDIGRIVEKTAEQIDQRSDLIGEGKVARADLFDAARQRAVMGGEQVCGDFFLGCEIAIERGVGHAHRKREIANRGSFDAFLREEPQRLLLDACACADAVARSCGLRGAGHVKPPSQDRALRARGGRAPHDRSCQIPAAAALQQR